MTTINITPTHASFFDADYSEAIEEVRDALEKVAPDALARWDRIALDQRTQNGLREQDHRDVQAKFEEKNALRTGLAFFDNDEYRANATEEQIKQADKKRRKIDRLVKEIREIQNKKYPGTCIEQIEAWAAKSSHMTFQRRDVKTTSDPDAAGKQLAKVRAAIADFEDTRRATEYAAATMAEAKARAHAHLDSLFKRGRPGVGGLYRVRKDASGKMVQGKISFPLTNDSTEHMPKVDTLALFAWLNRDALTKEIDQLIEAQAPKVSIPLAKRGAAVAEIDAEILTLEYEEGALIDVLQRAGRKVEYRPGMNVLAILGIEACGPKSKPKLKQEGMGSLVDPTELPGQRTRGYPMAGVMEKAGMAPAKK